MNAKLLGHAFFISLSGFLLGYDLCFIGSILTPVQRSLELCFPCEGGTSDEALAKCSCDAKEFAVSSVSIGAVLGGVLGGWIAESLGRRTAVLGTDVLFLLGGLSMGNASVASPYLFYLGRVLTGIALGAGGMTAAAYMTEISPPEIRGAMVEANELMVCVGCLTAYILAYALGDERWDVTVMAAIAPALLQGVAMAALVHESPRWLAERDRHNEARAAVEALGLESMEAEEPSSPTPLQEVEDTASPKKSQSKRERAKEKARSLWAHKRPLFIALGCALAHNATAGNTVLYYSRNVLQRAGVHHVLQGNIMLGLVKLFGVLVALLLVDRLGRRRMLLAGNAGIILSHVLLAVAFARDVEHPVSWLALTGMVGFILAWDISWAGLMMVVASEVLPQPVRSIGLGLTYSLYNAVAFVQEQTLQTLFQSITVAGTFALYAALCCGGELFVLKRVPETRGRTLEVIEEKVDVPTTAVVELESTEESSEGQSSGSSDESEKAEARLVATSA